MDGLKKHRYWIEGTHTLKQALLPLMVMAAIVVAAVVWMWVG